MRNNVVIQKQFLSIEKSNMMKSMVKPNGVWYGLFHYFDIDPRNTGDFFQLAHLPEANDLEVVECC